MADTVTKSQGNKVVKTKPIEEIIFSPENREYLMNESRQLL